MKNKWLILMYSLFLLSVCSTAFAFPEKTVEITVQKGDTLITLCNEHLEDPRRWKNVAKANHLRNPDLILPGQKLVIPVSLLKGIPLDAKVVFLKGEVTSQLDIGAEWLPLYLHDVVRQGSRVRTADESSAELAFDDGTSLLLKPNSLVTMTESKGKGGLQIIRFFLQTGRATSKVRGVTGRDSRFEIYTPSAVAAVRGTEFRASVDPSEATRSEVLHGVVSVQGMKRSVDVKEGEGTLVLKNTPPMEPKKLLRPPSVIDPEKVFKSLPLTFRFEEVENAAFYRAVLAKDQDTKDVIREKMVRPHDLCQIENVEDGKYFLQSSSIDEIGLEGTPTEPMEITVRVNPLPPILQSPLSGAEHRETSVDITWLKVPDVKRYHLQIAEDKEFRTIEDQDTIQGLTYRTKALDFKTYYFRVRSIADDGYEGAWSDVQSFSVVPLPPAPDVETPLIDNKEMSFRWNELGECIAFHFQMAGDAEFKVLLADEILDKPMITLQRPEHAGTYYVRTSSIDAKGYEGSFSKPQSFEIKQKFPYEVLGIMGALGLIILLL